MEKKSRNHLESSYYTLMRFLGSTTRSICNGVYYICPFINLGKLQKQDEGSILEVSIIKEPEVVSSVEQKSLSSMQASFSTKSQRIEVQSFFNGMKFKNKLERMKAEVFVEDFQSPLDDTRHKALKHLNEISKPAAKAILRKLLQLEEDSLKIIEILNSLSNLNDDHKLQLQIFTDFLSHHNSGVRQTALRVIARYADEQSFEIISSCLMDENAEVRRQALNCISWFFRDRCAPAVLKSLYDDDYHMRETAILICGTFKLRQSISALITLLSDPNKNVRKKAIDSIRKITGQNFEFDAFGSENNRKAAIEDWRFWWRDNQIKFMTK